jgi:hypothetical protein
MRNYYIENVCERNQQENKEYKEETNKNETKLVRYRELQNRNEDEPNYFMDLVENKKYSIWGTLSEYNFTLRVNYFYLNV